MNKNTSNRFEYAKYIIAHRKKIIELSKKAGCPFYWHDFHKLINGIKEYEPEEVKEVNIDDR